MTVSAGKALGGGQLVCSIDHIQEDDLLINDYSQWHDFHKLSL